MSEPDPEPKRTATKRPALSAREVRFAAAVAEHGNASQAYRAAGFPARAPESTWVLAFRLLRKPAVRELIREMQAEALDSARCSVDRIAQGLSRAAFADLRKLYDRQGRILLPHQWPDELALAVDAIESEDLFETVEGTDPDTGAKVRRKELAGYARKVRLTGRAAALKTLAAWKRMVGADLPPLEVLLDALPLEFAAAVRKAIGQVAVHDGGDPPSGAR